jgi:fermentation-respiration switch protein FrsA (DUF1100 family)
MNAIRNGLIFAAIVYAAVVLAMYLMQRQLLYFPANKGLTPAAVGIANAQTVELATADGERLVAWYSKAKEGRPTILYFHGNGGEIGDRPRRFQFYQSKGFGVLYVSYRGYGGSTGSPSEAGLMADAGAAYDWLLAQGVAPKLIVLVGESLGSGVAVRLATERQTAAVALEAPYTSAVDIGAQAYWWLPVRLLMKDRFESIKHIASINAPLLVVHGDVDQIIPVEHGRRLFEAAREPKAYDRSRRRP